MKKVWSILGVGLALAGATAAPTEAVTFWNICSPGAFKACASADVTIGPGNTLVIKVWNMNQSTTGSIADYASATGGWHTITAMGISGIGYTMSGASTSLTARYYNGTTYTDLTQWTAGNNPTNAQSLQIVNTGASVANGHQEGIVGCLDPGPTTAAHVSTCDPVTKTSTYPVAPFVVFTISGFSSLSLNNAVFEFHGQQAAMTSGCTTFDPNNRACTDNSLKGAGPPRDPPTTHVTPEPITMMLLGSGLLGIGGAAQRRRRRQAQIDHA